MNRYFAPNSHIGQQWPAIAIILVAASLRLPFLERQSIAFDESFSLAVGLADWSILFQAILSDGVHPPLFYVLHKLALMAWGTSEFGQRFMTTIFSLLGLPLIYRLGQRMQHSLVGLLAMLLLALNPLHIWFAQEARMYSFMSVLVTLSMLFFGETITQHSRSAWLKLTMTNALILLTHYFGLLVLVAQFVYLVLTFNRYHKCLRPWALSQMVAGFCLAPWLIATALRPVQSFGIGFLVRPTLMDLLLTFWNLTTGINLMVWPALFTLLSFGVAVWLACRSRPSWPHQSIQRPQVLLLCWGGLSPLVVWIMSQQRSFYADRYFSFCIPAILLLAAYGTFRLSNSVKQILLVGGLVLSTLVGLLTTWQSPLYQKDDWRNAATYISDYQQPGDMVLLRSLHIKFAFDYYYRGQATVVPATINLQEFDIDERVAKAKRVWLVYPYTRRPTHYPMQPLTNASVWDLEVPPPQFLKQWFTKNEANIIDSQRFLGVQVWLVDIDRR